MEMSSGFACGQMQNPIPSIQPRPGLLIAYMHNMLTRNVPGSVFEEIPDSSNERSLAVKSLGMANPLLGPTRDAVCSSQFRRLGICIHAIKMLSLWVCIRDGVLLTAAFLNT